MYLSNSGPAKFLMKACSRIAESAVHTELLEPRVLGGGGGKKHKGLVTVLCLEQTMSPGIIHLFSTEI